MGSSIHRRPCARETDDFIVGGAVEGAISKNSMSYVITHVEGVVIPFSETPAGMVPIAKAVEFHLQTESGHPVQAVDDVAQGEHLHRHAAAIRPDDQLHGSKPSLAL